MRWFQGTIAEAIAEAKKEKAIFVVYISGEDDRSVTMNTTFESEEVSTKLENIGCVAVKIQGNSEVCKQFSQIYPVVLIPSTYFIGDNGMPLEIIGGDISPEEFLTKIEGVHVLSPNKSGEQSTSDDIATSSTAKIEVSPEPEQPSNESLTAPSSSTSITNADNVGRLDDNVERAKQLIAQQRQQKAKMQIEEEKQSELKRRKLGQDIQKSRHRQEDAEAKQLAEDLAKERAEERAARERIKEQIAKDRAERASKFQADKREVERVKLEAQQAALQEQQERAEAEAAERSNFARLQFRLPDGSSITNQFSADDSLETVRRFLNDSPKCDLRSFTLSTTFPRREFQQEEFSQTLRELRLAPCAVIMVLPSRQNVVSGSGGTLGLLWTILGPLIAFFNYLRAVIFGQNPPPSNNSNQQVQQSSKPTRKEEEPTTKNSNLTKRKISEGGSNIGRKEGNIHRFANQDDDDDENNTWNGNSTQLM